jgi:4-diphosphocytidyl-2-C-methyl-D-erythritol kinase
MGAEYAAMSGSGSAVFGIFSHEPSLESEFDGMFKQILKL